MIESDAPGKTGLLANQVCLVTGASRTLGAAIARRMAAEGARVVVNYHNSAEAAHALCAELNAAGGAAAAIQADVSKPDQAERLVAAAWQQLGPIDILVNNVGPYVDTPFLEMPADDFDRILAGNIRATFLMSQAVGRKMKARGRGVIVNIAATDSYHRSHSVYGLAKSGVIHLTEAFALELAPEVRVNALAPDLIADNEGMEADFVAQSIAGTPSGRLVTRAEVAGMAVLLCTAAFDSVTGQTVAMDGGRRLPRINFGGTG